MNSSLISKTKLQKFSFEVINSQIWSKHLCVSDPKLCLTAVFNESNETKWNENYFWIGPFKNAQEYLENFFKHFTTTMLLVFLWHFPLSEWGNQLSPATCIYFIIMLQSFHSNPEMALPRCENSFEKGDVIGVTWKKFFALFPQSWDIGTTGNLKALMSRVISDKTRQE